MMTGNLRKSGFTLVELLAASTLGAFIALVAIGSLKAISDSAAIVSTNTATASEARFAAGMIARDLSNLYRDGNIENTRLVGAVKDVGQDGFCFLTLYTINRAKARVSQPEGDLYEVEYFLVKEEEKSALFRRLWPYPDKDVDPGGMLTAIAENIDIFEVRYFDGQEWSNEWPEEMQSLPELVEVTVVARPSNQREPAIESFIVNFARLPQQEAPAGAAGEQGTGSQQQGTESGRQNQGAGENTTVNRVSER